MEIIGITLEKSIESQEEKKSSVFSFFSKLFFDSLIYLIMGENHHLLPHLCAASGGNRKSQDIPHEKNNHCFLELHFHWLAFKLTENLSSTKG